MKINKFFSFLVVLALLVAAAPAMSARATGQVTVNKGDVALSGASQAGNFPEIWDLTQGDLTLSYTIDMTAVSQPAPWETSYTEVGIREVGAGNFNPGPWDTYQGGKGGWMASLVGDLTPTPVKQSLHDKHNLSASGGRGEGDYDAIDPNTVVALFGNSSNYGIWFDRDGVDQWQATYWGSVNQATYNTGGIYQIVIHYHAVTANLGTMFATINGIQTGFYSAGWKNAQPEKYPAGLSFKGDMTKMQVFTGIWAPNTTYGSVNLSDITVQGFPNTTGPAPSNVAANLNPAAVNSSVTLTANVDDSITTGWNIASAQFSLDGGTNWSPMTASDMAFDEVSEDVTVNFLAPSTPGIYDLCVRGTDAALNAGVPECTIFVVYDPTGGFVTGGGWIWSQAAQAVPIYNSIPATMPGSFASIGYEATSTYEAGDEVAFAGTDRALQSVTVNLTDWACGNDFDFVGGTWVPNRTGSQACVTTPGTGFNHPITLNIYTVDNSGPNPAVGALIASKTETFFIPFRPSADINMCGDPSTDIPFGGRWYDPVLAKCVHGYAFNIDFDFSADGITFPNQVIYGIAYNTGNYGAAPLGVNGPYNSLNLSLTDTSPSIGMDVETSTLFSDSSYGGSYCDGGAGGIHTFRRDAGCWETYTPVVQFNVQTEGAYKLDPSVEGKATFGFVSKYKKGATVPDGNTEFQFKAGELNFNSTSYEWLVVNQAGTNAQFKGSGTINGTGNYGFMLWAGDGAPDTFRIKIWDATTSVVVYDNGIAQAVGGGSIVVKKK